MAITYRIEANRNYNLPADYFDHWQRGLGNFGNVAYRCKDENLTEVSAYAYVYFRAFPRLAYIMERIDRRWSYSRWNPGSAVRGGNLTECRSIIKAGNSERLNFSKVEGRDSRQYASAFVYCGRKLVYVMERIGKVWFYSCWNRDKIVTVGTIKECRDAIRDDMEKWIREDDWEGDKEIYESNFEPDVVSNVMSDRQRL